MLKMILRDHEGKMTLLIGLGTENLKRLSDRSDNPEGMPIIVDLDDPALGKHPPITRIVVVDVSTPAALERIMRIAGPDTIGT